VIEQKKIFGTDGVRGVANVEPVTAETALKLGRAAAYVFAQMNPRRTPSVAHGERPTEGGSQQWFGVSAWQRPQESGRSQLRVGAYAVLTMSLFSGLILVLSSQWGVGLLLIVIGMVASGALLISRRVYPPLRLKSFDENLGG
jgi:hypothetical protein